MQGLGSSVRLASWCTPTAVIYESSISNVGCALKWAPSGPVLGYVALDTAAFHVKRQSDGLPLRIRTILRLPPGPGRNRRRSLHRAPRLGPLKCPFSLQCGDFCYSGTAPIVSRGTLGPALLAAPESLWQTALLPDVAEASRAPAVRSRAPRGGVLASESVPPVAEGPLGRSIARRHPGPGRIGRIRTPGKAETREKRARK